MTGPVILIATPGRDTVAPLPVYSIPMMPPLRQGHSPQEGGGIAVRTPLRIGSVDAMGDGRGDQFEQGHQEQADGHDAQY
jgi:hypothetical protein